MIDQSEPMPIRFSSGDQPELPDVLSEELGEERERERLRREGNLRWLEEHTGFRPMGAEW